MGAIAALALAPLALTGCSGASSSAAAPTPMASTASASPSATRTAIATPPSLPDAAKSATRDGAKAFTAFFFEVVNYSIRVSDGTELRRISLASCSTCINTARDADRARSSNWTPVGGEFKVVDLAAPGGTGKGVTRLTVDALVSRAAGRVLDGGQSPIASNPASPKIVYEVVVVWQGGKWQVASAKSA